mgnify:CR=1 FL=1
MTVTFLTSSVSSMGGGLFPVLLQMASKFCELPSVKVSVLGLEDAHTQKDLPLWGHVKMRAYRVIGPRAWGYAPGLKSALVQENPDLVHVHGLWMYPSVASLYWSRRSRKPYLISPHGMLDPWALRNSAWKKRLAAGLYEQRHLSSATCLHALCDHEAQAIREYGLSNPIAVIPNGINLPPNCAPAPPSWDSLLPEDGKALLYLGRLHPKKGLPDLMRAWAAVEGEPEAEAWHLVVAGWDQGRHEATLQRLGAALGIRRKVYFVGPQFGQDKEASFGRASAFILPSLSEGLPITVLEAWAYGLPVIMTPQCNLPEGFQKGAAIPVDPSVQGITTGLRELFRMSDADRHHMGERGRQLVQQQFTWPTVVAQFKEVYEWMLGGHSKPAWVRS